MDEIRNSKRFGRARFVRQFDADATGKQMYLFGSLLQELGFDHEDRDALIECFCVLDRLTVSTAITVMKVVKAHIAAQADGVTTKEFVSQHLAKELALA